MLGVLPVTSLSMNLTVRTAPNCTAIYRGSSVTLVDWYTFIKKSIQLLSTSSDLLVPKQLTLNASTEEQQA